MTASQRNRATSYNSVPHPSRAGTENVAPQRDLRIRSIAQHVNNRNGVVTATGITSEDGWTRDESGNHITWVQTANLLLDNLQEPNLLLTPKVEPIAQGADL